MIVQVDERFITLDGQRLRYNPYSMDLAANEKGRARIDVFRSMLAQWAVALASLNSEDRALFLPYSLEDETVECLAARLKGDHIILRSVDVNSSGYLINLADHHDFMHETHDIGREYPTPLTQLPKSELVAALLATNTEACLPDAAPIPQDE